MLAQFPGACEAGTRIRAAQSDLRLAYNRFTLKPIPHRLLLCASLALWSSWGHAAALDLPERPGAFWLQLDTLPEQPQSAVTQGAPIRFGSLAALTEHALRARPESRAAWLGIQAEAARLDAASAANWPTLTGQFNFTQSRALSSSGASVPTLHRYGPSLSARLCALRLWRARSQHRRPALSAHRQPAEQQPHPAGRDRRSRGGLLCAAGAQAQVDALAQLEIALRASLDAVDVRLRGGLVSRADQLRARAALAEATLARQAAAARPGQGRGRTEAGSGHRADAGAGARLGDRCRRLRWKPAPCWRTCWLKPQRQRPDLQALQAAAASARLRGRARARGALAEPVAGRQ